MTIKELQNELSRIKKYYQMTGEDAEVMDEVSKKLEDCKAEGVIFDHFGRKYTADRVTLKTIDSKGVCSFYGFRRIAEDDKI